MDVLIARLGSFVSTRSNICALSIFDMDTKSSILQASTFHNQIEYVSPAIACVSVPVYSSAETFCKSLSWYVGLSMTRAVSPLPQAHLKSSSKHFNCLNSFLFVSKQCIVRLRIHSHFTSIDFLDNRWPQNWVMFHTSPNDILFFKFNLFHFLQGFPRCLVLPFPCHVVCPVVPRPLRNSSYNPDVTGAEPGGGWRCGSIHWTAQ